jgi:hypothetical protein
VNDGDMMPPMNLRGWLALLLLPTVTLPAAAAAEADKTLSGRWSASTTRASWSIASWGDACGPRPTGESIPGGIVTIAMGGGELVIDGLGRSYSTRTCWESGQGQRITSHGASGRAWRTVCESAAGDPRRAAVITTLSATDNRIDFSETGQYEFAINGQTCRATLSRSRVYSLVEREGETRPIPPSPPPVSQPVSPQPASKPELRIDERLNQSCTTPGAPARLEVHPAHKLLRAGDEYSFRGRVYDRAGCPVERQLAWRLDTATTTLNVTATGSIRVPKNATEGSATLTATVQDRTIRVTVDVVSERRYAELLLGGEFDDRGETRDSIVVTIESVNVGTKAAILEEKARSRRLIFVSVIGVIALGLGAASLWMGLGRRQKRQPSAEPDASVESTSPAPEAERSGGALVCPTCHDEYPPETRFCAVDGNRLVPLPAGAHVVPGGGGVCPVCGQGFDPGISACPIHDEELVPRVALALLQPVPVPQTRRICPICGTVYEAESQFCGNDGTALVPIN